MAGNKRDEYGLTSKWRQFADLYRAGPDEVRGNAKQCYLSVYPKVSDKTAEVNGSKLLSNTKVAAYLKMKADEVTKKADIDAQWVLDQAVKVHNRCMQSVPVLDRKGNQMYCKVELEGTEDENGDPETKELVPAYTFNATQANKSLELVGKHVNVRAFEKEQINTSLTVNIEGKDALA